MIDSDGYRPNVGIVLCNGKSRLFWARRIGMDSWQFPQGGIRQHENPEEAMFRELYEETGLCRDHVKVLGRTREWLRYELPDRFIRRHSQPLCIGQKQIWYLLRLTGSEENVRFDCSDKPEFDAFNWVDYWDPIADVIYFKRGVYRQALTELQGYIGSNPKTSSRKRRLHKGRKRWSDGDGFKV